MNLDDATRWTVDGTRATGTIPAGWGQGRAAFGGLVVGSALRALRTLMPPDRQLRSCLTDFVGPALEGPIEAELRLLRAGRSVSHAQAILTQGDDVRAVVIGVYGATRATALPVPGPARPDSPDPESLPRMPFIKGVIPDFLANFDIRILHGIPFSGGDRADLRWWVRPDGDVPIDEHTVATLIDLPPPPIITKAKKVVPVSSVTWQLDLLEPPRTSDRWWLYDSHCAFSSGGYADLNANLWAQDGRLIARTRQLNAEFSGR